MGFCYSANGLCCDFCNADHSTRKYVRKIKCPYEYCQAWACCDQCRSEKKHMSSSCAEGTHKETCKELATRADKKEQEKQAILDAGHFVRIAALGHEDQVKVIFANKEGKEKAAWMTQKEYRKYPLGVTKTLEDFEILRMTYNTDIYDSEGLEVTA